MFAARKKGLIKLGGFLKGHEQLNKIKGKDHWNWKGGISGNRDRKSRAYMRWRMDVFTRDNFTCQDCMDKDGVSGKLEAHHIKPFSLYPEFRFDLNNGLTLCKDCHAKTSGYKSKKIALAYLSM